MLLRATAAGCAVAVLLSGCSSTPHEAQRSAVHADTAAPAAVRHEADTGIVGRVPGAEAARTLAWKPHFIATGYASGIMIEFTGMKNDKPVNARFASIEVRDAAGGSAAKTFTSTINALRQAFFELPPGRYIVRQTRTWADQAPIHTVEVKEGHYSLVPVSVVTPKSPKQISDRLGE